MAPSGDSGAIVVVVVVGRVVVVVTAIVVGVVVKEEAPQTTNHEVADSSQSGPVHLLCVYMCVCNFGNGDVQFRA